MASEAYIQAAKQAREGKREPVVLLRVEDVATIERVYTTKGDWDGSATLTRINTEFVLGSAVNIIKKDSGAELIDYSFNVGDESFLYKLENVTLYWSKSYGVDYRPPQILCDTNPPDTPTPRKILTIRDVVELGDVTTTDEATRYWVSCDVFFNTDSSAIFDALTEISFLSIPAVLEDGSYILIGANGKGYFVPTAGGSILTSTIDLGQTPSAAALFFVDDTKPTGASLTYEAFADDVDPPTTSRGAVVDGDTIGAVGYQYYRIEATFDSTNGALGELQEIRISGGDQTVKLFGTHRNQPTQGVVPLLPANPIGSLSSKIELDKPTSVGEIGCKLLWTKESGDMLATGYLRNKAVQILHGFLGLDETEFETIFTGSWANYTADQNKRLIDISTQNVLRRFMKIKIPRETFAADGSKSTVPLAYTADNAVQVILDLVEELGIADRYIDRTTIEGLRDGLLSGAEYNVTRTITTPVEAWKLVHELATLCGCFVVVLPSGKMTMVRYDENASPAATLDARLCDFTSIDGGQADLFTRQLIYFDPAAGVTDPGEQEEDYDKGYLLINATSETAYSESSEHRWFDKWNASTAVIAAMANRWDRWQGTPRLRLSAKNVSLRHIGVLEGQTVRAIGLRVPCEAENYETESEFTALVLKRTIDPVKCVMSFDLLQISDAFTGFTSGFSGGFR